MAIEKTFILKADTKEALKNVEKLTDSIEEVSEASEDLEKQNKVTAKSAKGVGTAVKSIGTALKAIGIGLVIALFAKLADSLSKNQKAVDFFSTSVEFLGLAFNDLFTFIFDNAGGVIDFFKDIFENPTKNIKLLRKAIQHQIIESFVSLLEVSGFLATALKKLFVGDFSGALDAVKDAGKEAVDVFTGVDDSVDKTIDLVEDIAESTAKYAKETLNSAKANVQLRNSAELAAAQQGRLVEQFDRAAEKQRQIRDEERNSIAERIKANDKLKGVLDDQEKALLSQAGLQIAAAQANLQSNDTIEAQVALVDALANKEAILAQVEGFRSEQLVNDLGLKKEQIELDQTITDAERERQLSQLAFEAELETDPLKKIEKQKLALVAENEAILADLERKRELFKLGTQARTDAEEEFLTRKQEISNEEIALNAARNKIIDKNNEDSNNNELIRQKAVEDAKVGLAQNTLALIGSVASEGSKIAKGVQVAQTVISGIQGVQSAFTTASASPITTVFPAYPLIQAGLAGVFSALQVKKILSTDASGKTAPNLGGAAGGGGQSAPSFNVVGNSGASQLSQTLNEERTPVQSFVVGSAVTSQQALDRDIVETASLG